MGLPDAPPSKKPPLGERLQAHLVEFGSLAVGVYFGIFAVVLFGFALAITLGFDAAQLGGPVATAGTWGVAYIATKVTQPLRIAATLALTPVIAAVLRRRKRARGADGTPTEETEAGSPGASGGTSKVAP